MEDISIKYFNQQGLEELHRRLMEDSRSDGGSLGEELAHALNNLGVYTQEVLSNMGDGSECQETALRAACRSAKPRTLPKIEQLLSLQAKPDLECFRNLMSNTQLGVSRRLFAAELLRFSHPELRLRAMWLACILGETDIVELCLDLNVDSNSTMDLDVNTKSRDFWSYPAPPLPIQYAACRSYERMVHVLEKLFDYDKHAASEFYVDYLLIAACNGHDRLASEILERQQATLESWAQIYEVLGAHEVIVGNVARGKSLWRIALSYHESGGTYKSRLSNDILCLEPRIQGFRTVQEIEAMRAKELRIQALAITRLYAGDSYLFSDALLRREYSKKISVFALEFLRQRDWASVKNIRRVEDSLEQQGFFLFPDRELVSACLLWCVQFAGELRTLLEIQPYCAADLDRLELLVDFTCRILQCVEKLEGNLVEIEHILRRTLSVFQPLNERCCLLERLHCMQMRRKGPKHIFRILNDASADLVVLDAAGELKRDFTLADEDMTNEDGIPVVSER